MTIPLHRPARFRRLGRFFPGRRRGRHAAAYSGDLPAVVLAGEGIHVVAGETVLADHPDLDTDRAVLPLRLLDVERPRMGDLREAVLDHLLETGGRHLPVEV